MKKQLQGFIVTTIYIGIGIVGLGFFAKPALAASFDFAARKDYTVGGPASSIISGDFDADGNIDLATTNYDRNNVSILLGDGDGRFGAKTDYAVGSKARSVTTGDFDADGKTDLAVANHDSESVSILLGVGDGTFGTKTDYTVGGAVRSVTTGDFDEDGTTDIATANFDSNTVSILLGVGDGTFGTKTDYTAGTDADSVTTGDFDADGNTDLAVANRGSGNISILLGVGDGTFGTKTDYTAGTDPSSVKTGDFDADGKTDLAVSNYISSDISILLGAGDGTFGAKTDYAVGYKAESVTTGDFNADGKTDLVTANYDNRLVSLRLGAGDGTFGAKTDYAAGWGPADLITGDFNEDGRTDLAVANFLDNDVSIFRNITIKNITGFTIHNQVGTTTINQSNRTISLTMPYGTNVTSLIPKITITGTSVSPASGIANNFTTPQIYTVRGSDSTTQKYTITVNVVPKPILTKLYPKSGKVTINVVGGTKTIQPFASSYTGRIWAYRVRFNGPDAHYIFLNKDPYGQGSIKYYDENGNAIQNNKPYGLFATHGMTASMIVQQSNGKVYLAIGFRRTGYTARIYEVTKKGLVVVANVAASTTTARGTILVGFLKLYGNDYGLTTMKSGAPRTLKVWKKNAGTSTWFRDTNESTLAKLKVVDNKVVLR